MLLRRLGDLAVARLPITARLLDTAWVLRDNVAARDALYVAAAQTLSADLLTTDRLAWAADDVAVNLDGGQSQVRSSACASSRRRTIRGMSQAPLLRGELPPEIPDDVDDPAAAKASGVVTLPLRINWSRPNPTYDLSDRGQRIRVYEQVLREGSAADVRFFIDVDELIDLWDEMVLPRAVSEA